MRCKHKNVHALQNHRTCLRFWLKRSLFFLSIAAVASASKLRRKNEAQRITLREMGEAYVLSF